MNLVVITALAAVVIVILQIIILANQKKNATLISEFIAEKAKAPSPDRDRFRERRDGNFNKNRRGGAPQNSAKAAPAPSSAMPPAANVDNVEKSLRDINLKLKNAERDQDAARRKIGDAIGKDGVAPQRQQRPPREGNRENRDSRGGRGGNRNGRGGNNFRGRNDSDRGGEINPPSEDHPAVETYDDAVMQSVDTPQAAVPQATPPQVTTPASLPELKPVDFDTDMEHGRKFAVKRRVLQDEGASNVGQASSDDAANVQETSSESSAPSDAEISFGRR